MERSVLDVGNGLTRGIGYSYVLASTGTNSCIYQWRLGSFLNSQATYLETEDFVAGEYKWKLRLFPKVTHHRVDYVAVNLVSLNPAEVTANLVMRAVNHINPQNDRVAGARFIFKPNEQHGFPFFQDHFSVVNPLSGFFYNGSYAIVAGIKVVPTEAGRGNPLLQSSVPSTATRTINASVLTDELFHQKIDKMHPFGLVYLPDGGVLSLDASMGLSAFAATVARACGKDGRDEGSGRFWICSSGSDGSARVQRPLRSSDCLTIGDLCTRTDNASTGQLTLYFETSKDGSRLPELHDDSWILFCKFMHPNEERVSYLGCIVLRKSCTVHDLETKTKGRMLETNARGLAQWPRGAEPAIVIQKEDLCPIGVARTVTLENSGLRNGDVFLLYLKPPNSMINMDRLHSRLKDLFCQSFQSLTLSADEETNRQQHGADNYERTAREGLAGPPKRQMRNTISGQPSDQRSPQDEEELCVICLDKPRTSGFLHADSEAHVCACIDCAEAVMKKQNPRCPLCNQAIIHLIKKLR